MMTTLTNKDHLPPSDPSAHQIQSLFDLVAEDNVATVKTIQEQISKCGLSLDDYRLRTMRTRLEEYKNKPIDIDAFTEIVREELLSVKKY